MEKNENDNKVTVVERRIYSLIQGVMQGTKSTRPAHYTLDDQYTCQQYVTKPSAGGGIHQHVKRGRARVIYFNKFWIIATHSTRIL